MSIRAVFFDSGDTLMRPIGGSWFPGHRFFEICASFGVGVNADELLENACTKGGEYLYANHHAVPDEDAEERQFVEYYRIVLRELGHVTPDDLLTQLAHAIVREPNFEPFPDTKEVLEHLTQRKIPMAVLTDAWPSVRTKFQSLGYHDYFETIVISAEAGCVKPDMGMFEPALNALNVKPSEVLFVDDALDLVQAAGEKGFRWLLADYGNQHPHIHHRIGRLVDVLHHV